MVISEAIVIDTDHHTICGVVQPGMFIVSCPSEVNLPEALSEANLPEALSEGTSWHMYRSTDILNVCVSSSAIYFAEFWLAIALAVTVIWSDFPRLALMSCLS